VASKSTPGIDAIPRAEAAAWLWQNRETLHSAPRRAALLSDGPALATWQSNADRLDAVVAGPTYLADLCPGPPGFRCALSDSDGRSLVGERPTARMVATRTASATGLPWTLHLSATTEAAASS